MALLHADPHPVTALRVRLLGGFEVWDGERPIAGFESQKTRALLAYLIAQRGRSFSRDHLAGLLWPESDPESARHALRQAIYSLRSKLPAGSGAPPPLAGNHRELRFDPAADCWLDVAAFEEALRRGATQADLHHLAAAVQLYRGDFLAGFYVKDGAAFEEWLLAEQERLRQAAVEALRTLVESYRRRGEVRFASHYAHRLLALDPLSEPIHRELMRLSAAAGQRGRALAQYEELRQRLREELGVEPGEETRALYAAIRADAEEKPGPAPAEDAGPVGPLVPLVGRDGPLATLAAAWRQVQAGSVHWTLVEGEAGVGKSRLIKTALDAALAQGEAVVLQGRGSELDPPPPLWPIVEALRAYFAERGAADQGVGDRTAAELADLCCGLARQHGVPLVLYLDDLHLADHETCELLDRLAAGRGGCPAWLLTARRPRALWRSDPRAALVTGKADRLQLARLPAAAVEEIAGALVPEGEAAELGAWLVERADGLPLLLTELVNLLRDEGVLASRDPGGWRLTQPLAEVDLPDGTSVDEIVLRRTRALPPSARRLATLAAVIGNGFELSALTATAGEHPTVVEVGIDVLLQHWLVRRATGRWTGEELPLEEEAAGGARVRRFEFAHPALRKALYGAVDPERRQVLHGEVAAALAEANAGDPRRECAAIAHHWLAAGLPGRARRWLELAAARAAAVGAEESAVVYATLAARAAAAISSSARATPAASPTSTRR